MDHFKKAVKIVRTYVFTNFKKTLISTIFRLIDKNIKKIENFHFLAGKSIFSSVVHKKNSSKIAIKKVDFYHFYKGYCLPKCNLTSGLVTKRDKFCNDATVLF